ncbi:MAG: hypothetical protein A3G25_21090 [Betaproteobacteria bacterium RIFCSPLOWO2_12_FULL_63_13]|nr:MAG: hypothetical protein A3H32_18480 [Betaproteobacteria bacterium RIFCSPLOWO2_02_FULL_63_19]OGA47191.1 MAG: hypothetical protein A3G25_21090 [Betaproteobacteria bacterium RIFCSPLOWO2_12_FULL_63_13]
MNAPGPDRTRWATFALHASAVLYVPFGLLLAVRPFAWDPAVEPEYALRAGLIWGLAALCVALAGFVEVIAAGLRHGRRWALHAATTMFVLYLPSAFLPLGAIGLVGVLSQGTRARFPVPRSDTARRSA